MTAVHTTPTDRIASPELMREVLGTFVSGVTIVAGEVAGEPVGFACQSFASVSLDPPLVLFCASHTSRSWPRIAGTGRFVVSVLAEDQREVCARFGSSVADKFSDVAWHPSIWGPAIDGALASVHCDIEQVHTAGDHDVVIGRVRELITHRQDGPLVFFRGGYGLRPC